MTKNYQISVHGKERVRQRTDYSRTRDIEKLFQKAVTCGKSPSNFKPPFSDFLKLKLEHGSKIKVYQNLIFIYKGRKLITSYPVPKRYLLQLNMDKKKDQIRSETSGMNNKELRALFLSKLDMLISLVQINKSMMILSDDYTFGELNEMCQRINVMLNVLQCRINPRELKYEQQEINDENIIDYMKSLQTNFAVLTSNYVGFGATKGSKTTLERKNDSDEFFILTEELQRCTDFLESKSFYLVQNQCIEED